MLMVRTLTAALTLVLSATAYAWECPPTWEYDSFISRKIREWSNGGPCTPPAPKPNFQSGGNLQQLWNATDRCQRTSTTQVEYDRCAARANAEFQCSLERDRRAYEECIASKR